MVERYPSSRMEESVNGFRRVFQVEPGYNDRGGKYGVAGMGFRFVLIGDQGATQFTMNTGWVPGEKPSRLTYDLYPSAWDLGYHWKVNPFGSEYHSHFDDCEWLPGECWYDGSGLNAIPVMHRFIQEGMPAVWQELEDYYADIAGSCTTIVGEIVGPLAIEGRGE